MGVPQITMGFNTKSWSSNKDDWGYPVFGKHPYVSRVMLVAGLYFVVLFPLDGGYPLVN